MTEEMLKLDANNYQSELKFLLENNIFTFDEYKSFNKEGKLTASEWKEIKDFYNK